jgi:hypothetical protein
LNPFLAGLSFAQITSKSKALDEIKSVAVGPESGIIRGMKKENTSRYHRYWPDAAEPGALYNKASGAV